jgi:hypothetical protein
MKKMPSQEYLKECFDYNSETGLLYWKHRPLSHFKSEGIYKTWNSKYAGKAALNSVDSSGYLSGKLDRENFLAHRIIWKLYYDEQPNHILHEDGNIRDNRIEKLTSDTHNKNMLDLKIYKNNSSGISGVNWETKYFKWKVQINASGKRKYLGLFEDFFEACCVRKSAEIKLGYHSDHGKR